MTEPLFFVSMICGTLMLLLPFFYLTATGTVGNAGLFKTSQAMIFPFAAPLLAALPYAGMLMLEKDTRFDSLILLKIRRTGYALPRFFSVGLTGALALFIPQILLLAVVLISGLETLNITECFSGVLLSLPFGFAYSSFAFALSFYNVKRYIPVVTPQVLYMLCIYAFPHLKLVEYYPPLGISPWIYGSVEYSNILFVFAVIAVISVVMTFFGGVMKNGKR